MKIKHYVALYTQYFKAQSADIELIKNFYAAATRTAAIRIAIHRTAEQIRKELKDEVKL